MTDLVRNESEFILYQTEDGRTRIECRFEGEALWLTQAQIAELFQTTPQNITLHLKELYAAGELDEEATCKAYLQVRREGPREVKRSLRHYNLDAILAIGFRVRSHRARSSGSGPRRTWARPVRRKAAEPTRLRRRGQDGLRRKLTLVPHHQPRRISLASSESHFDSR